MDLEIIKRIFFYCGKKSSSWLTSKFFYDFYLNGFELYELEMNFPGYGNIIKNILLKKKHNNLKTIRELSSIYHKYNADESIQNIYLFLFINPFGQFIDLVYYDDVHLSTKPKYLANVFDTATSLRQIANFCDKTSRYSFDPYVDVLGIPTGDKLINLITKHDIKISNTTITNRNVQGITKYLLSIPFFENIEKIDFGADSLSFSHENLKVFRFEGNIGRQYNLPNLKKIKIVCHDTIDILDTFPQSSKIEAIKIPNFSLTTLQPKLKDLTISYNTLLKSNFFDARIKSLTVIDDFPDFQSYDDFVELCRKSNLIIDDVENLTLSHIRPSSDLLKFIDRRRIYRRIKLRDSHFEEGAHKIFQLAEFTFSFLCANVIFPRSDDIHTFKKPNILKKFEFRPYHLDYLGVFGGHPILRHVSKLTNLESLRLVNCNISDAEVFYQKLCHIKTLKKIYVDKCPIEEATKILKLGTIRKIDVHLWNVSLITREIIDEFCLGLTKNCIRELSLNIWCNSWNMLSMIEYLFKSIDESEMKLRYIICRIFLGPDNIEPAISINDVEAAISINNTKSYGFMYIIEESKWVTLERQPLPEDL